MNNSFKVILLVIVFPFIGNTQTQLEFGYSAGTNATTAQTIQSNNMTWGYYTPPYPTTWNNQWSVGFGNEKNKLFAVLDHGDLGVTFKVRAYPNKYPYDDSPSVGDSYVNYSTITQIKGSSRTNSNLLKLSLLYKHDWTSSKKLHHKSVVGLGYLKTRTRSREASFGSLFWADSTIGEIRHTFKMDKFEYFRNQNVYITAGYELSYDFGEKWSLNASLLYNQGLFKMIRWHTFREYSESLTGYSEFDEQWSVTRLSHFSALIGVSFSLDLKKD